MRANSAVQGGMGGTIAFLPCMRQRIPAAGQILRILRRRYRVAGQRPGVIRKGARTA
jgi:hypothetical protein